MSHLLRERVGRVLVLTLNRPERHNAITPELAEDLVIEVERAGDDVRAAVIRGAGRSFCAGYDLSGGRREPGGRGVTAEARGLRHLSRCWDRLLHAPLPVIAQIHGHCLAGGTDLAGHCDLVITAEDASIGFPAVRSMGVALTQMWIYHVGPQWAKRLLLTGDTMTGKLAAGIGFALTAVPSADLEPETMALAHHRTAPARAFAEQVRTEGLRAAVARRDAPFAPDHALDLR